MKSKPNAVFSSWWEKFASDERRVRVVVALGLAGMLLILIGNFVGERGDTAQTQPDDTSASFVSETEERLQQILSQVRGVGKVNVLVTLESGSKAVYAVNEKQTQEVVSTYADGTIFREEETGDLEQSYLLVDSGSGKAPLILTNTEPTVRGVVVVCEGASSAVTRAAVLDAVTTALGVGANQVCILEYKS
jgi:stage III sporulation protein AG